jgi:uncharacterized membrane protein YgdD (TMEM256/DUF423 family)
VAGSISGLIAVALGAFGSHGLEGRLPDDLISIFGTGNVYHFYHSLALLAVGLAALQIEGKPILASGWCFLAGILFFSGSLYVLALTGIRTLGAITPIGGVLFIAGWALLAVAAWSAGKQPGPDLNQSQ